MKDRMARLGAAMSERRVLQWTVGYLAAAWGIAEATGFIIDNYNVTPRLLDVLLFLLAVGFVTMLVLVWFHGARGPQRLLKLEVALLIVLAAVGVGGAFSIGTRPLQRPEFAAGAVADLGEGSVAVLPFRNSVADPNLEWLDRGVAELLATHLAQLSELKVVGNQRLFDLLRQEGVMEAGAIPSGLEARITRRAGARFMLTGSVVGRPGDLVMTANLADARTGEITASANARGSDVFALVDEISAAMSSQITGEPVEQALTPVAQLTSTSIEAYSEYLRGREAAFRFLPREAIEHFERAIALDSTFALAHFRLGAALFQVGDATEGNRHLWLARQNLRTASERDRLFIDGMTTFQRDTATGAAMLRELASKYPDEKDGRITFAALLSAQNPESREAKRLLEETLRLDPYYAPGYNTLAYIEAQLGNHAAADSLIERYVELEPDQPNPLDSRGEIREFAGRFDEARASYRAALQRRPDFVASLRSLTRTYLKQDRPTEARRELEGYAASPFPDVRVTAHLLIGDTHAWEGRIEQGLESYEAADREAVAEERPNLRVRPLLEIAQGNLDLGRYTPAYRTASELRELQPVNGLWATVLFDSLAALGDIAGMQRLKAEFDEMVRSHEQWSGQFPDQSAITAIKIADARGDAAGVLELAEDLLAGRSPFDLYGWPVARAKLELGRAEEVMEALQAVKNPPYMRASGARWDPLPQRRLQYFEARLLEALGDTAQAIEGYERFIASFGPGVAALPFTADAPQRLQALRGG